MIGESAPIFGFRNFAIDGEIVLNLLLWPGEEISSLSVLLSSRFTISLYDACSQRSRACRSSMGQLVTSSAHPDPSSHRAVLFVVVVRRTSIRSSVEKENVSTRTFPVASQHRAVVLRSSADPMCVHSLLSARPSFPVLAMICRRRRRNPRQICSCFPQPFHPGFEFVLLHVLRI